MNRAVEVNRLLRRKWGGRLTPEKERAFAQVSVEELYDASIESRGALG